MEPVLVAGNIGLHRHVHIGLIQRNARQVGEGQIDEAAHVAVVGCGVVVGRRHARAVDQAVHGRRLVAHGVKDGVLAVIAPEEEILGIVQPAGEHVGVKRHDLLVQLRAPIGAGDLVQGGADADLAQAFLQQDADRLVHIGEAQVEGQGRFEPVGHSRFRQQGARLVEIVVERMRLRPCDLGWAAGLAEHRPAETEQDDLHDLVVGNGIGDRLAHFWVVEWRLGDVHADILDAVAVGRGHQGQLAGGLHLREVLGRQIVGNVRVAALQQGAPVARRRHHPPDHPADFRHCAALPGLVAFQDHLGARGPFGDLVGPRTGGVLLGVFQAPGVVGRGVLLHQARVHHARHDDREVGQGQAILAQEIDPHRMIVDHHKLLGLFQAAGLHLEGWETADDDGSVQGPFHIRGADRGAVLEGGVAAQLEGHGHVADGHVLGQFGHQFVAVVIWRAVRPGLHAVGDQPVIAIPRHLVAGDVGADPVDVQIVGTAFGDDQQGFVARLGAGRGMDGGSGEAGGHGQKRATLHDVPLGSP